ncbi:MAG: DUF4249 domain-containing protein [Cyclobacteriaceae bacterium]|nr:DUF4249 domain-containing protein [Cyclobacteriaceae bacterium HetDA_MAG_MS6]
MNKNIIVIIAILVAVVACEDVIDWKVDESETRLVVEGRVTNEMKQHTIRLTQTSSYFNASQPAGVSGARVTISDGISTFNFTESEQGYYISDAAFQGEIGRTYTLNIALQSPLNLVSNYTASGIMEEVMTLDSMYVTYDAFEDIFGELEDSVHIIKFFATELDIEGDFFMFEVWRNGALWTDSVDELSVVSDEFIDGFEFEDFDIYTTTDFEIGDEVTLKVYSVDEGYFDFINEINAEIEGGDPFGTSGPPANVGSNISGGGLGYFLVAAVDSISAPVLE